MVADLISFVANSLTVTLFLGYLFALWAALVAWTWFDISARTDNFLYRFGAILIVATGAVFGFAIYLLLRPSLTREEVEVREIEEAILASQSQFLSCPSCHSSVREDFAYCPNCSFKLHTECSSCGKQINISWGTCPYCGKEREKLPQVKPAAVPVAVALASDKKTSNIAFFSTIVSLLRKRNEKRRARPKQKLAPKKPAKAKKSPKTPRRKKA
jgi:RNA polymerase subunit RPABC4/transcription elongation factor Spt4